MATQVVPRAASGHQPSVTTDAECAVEAHEKAGEKRRTRRTRLIRGATIVFNRGYTLMNCLMLDLSKTGARLKPDDILLCPSEFTLRFPDGSGHLCEVEWRKGYYLGVRFL